MIVYNLAKSQGSDITRLFQAVITNMFRHGSWCCQPEKTSSNQYIMVANNHPNHMFNISIMCQSLKYENGF